MKTLTPFTDKLLSLRQTLIESFEKFEPRASFEKKDWAYKHEGGGQIGLLRGDVFEKAAVNFSYIKGPNFPMNDGLGPFEASGISLITHMHNPHVPTAHLNVRMIKTENNYWIGGGYDLTPMPYIHQEDTTHFHSKAKAFLDRYDLNLYKEFKKNADEYFFIPHRNKTRGVGGIFFDHFSFNDLEKDEKFLEGVVLSFMEALIPIIQRHHQKPYTFDCKQKQNITRAHYVEFNLLYDRGTRFGFLSQGNPEAILCSMPPSASW